MNIGQKCRCSRCNARRTLPKPLDEYARPPKCKHCGTRTMYVDKHRDSRKDKRKLKCFCTGYWFPHMKGSKWCHHNPDLDALLEQESPRKVA